MVLINEQLTPRRVPRRIGYRDRTGHPEGLPSFFVRFVIDFPDKRYGTWWYIHRTGEESQPEGWYLWIESLALLGVSRGNRLSWRRADTLEEGLTRVANELRREP